ncbi:MAG: DUF3052 domain-containing protein [Ilumatobacteraceae bacterium]
MTAGYSGTPLARKLGIRAGDTVVVIGEPDGFRSLLTDLPAEVTFSASPSDLEGSPGVVIAFETERAHLAETLAAVVPVVHPDRAVWIAWPKKAAKVPTELTGDVVRAAILATSLVDVKVCAIDDTWSGLKSVWRKELR